MAAAISLLLLVIGSGLHLGRSVGDAEQWCQYVASTPEPSLLFYNRIPKSGSTTMKAIIKRQNRNSFDNVPMPVEFWGQSYATKEAKNKVYDFINRNKHSRGKTVIDGHIQYFDFDARKISIRDNDRMEYMQVMRKCTDRSASNYYYAMYDNNRANAAKRANKYEQYKHDLFGTSDIYKCKRNDTCIVKTPIFQNIGTNIISLYMVGSACGQDCKDSPLGKIEAARTQTAAASGRYVTFGPIERLADYLEMLECVYPSYFKGANKLYLEKPIHDLKSHKDELQDHMKDLFAAKCNGSSDDALYTELLTLFSERHAMMKQEAGKCCRKAVEVANTPTSGHGVAHKKEVNAKKKIKPQQ